MVAANPLCRLLLLAVGLAAVIGCKSDAPVAKARGQLPQDPIAPIAPPLTPPPGTVTPFPPNTSLLPAAAPAVPAAGSAGVVPALGGAVAGSPVPLDARGPVVNTGGLAAANLASSVDRLKAGIPRVKVIAIVGANNVITDQEIREAVWMQIEELSKLQGRARAIKEKEFYNTALRKMIERELILDEMYTKLKKANKAAVIDEIKEFAVQSAEKQIREMKKKTGSKSDDDLNAWLRVQGLTLPVLRRQLERQIMSQQYVNSMLKETGRRVGLAEIRDYYDKHPDEFKTLDKVKWQHVFVSFTKHTVAPEAGFPAAEANKKAWEKTVKAAYDHAEGIRQKAVAGADFTALSKEFDNGYAALQGGLGIGEKRGEIQPPDLEPTVWSLKTGEVSGLIQTPTGYHIVKVVQRDYESLMPFDSKVQTKVRDKLNDALNDQNAKKMIDDLWRKGVVRVLEE